MNGRNHTLDLNQGIRQIGAGGYLTVGITFGATLERRDDLGILGESIMESAHNFEAVAC